MSDTNPAQAAGGDEALSFNDGADAISNLLADPAETLDLSEEDQGEEQEASEGAEAEGEEQPEAEASEEASEEDGQQQEEGGPGYESGKFAADTANVRLKDGTVISVQDLKRGYLSQASFTRGSQENAKERDALASRSAEVEQTAQSLKQQREFLLHLSQQFLPQAPDESLLNQNSATYDPIRYMSEKADYDKRLGMLQQLQQYTQAEQARVSQEQQSKQKEVRDREVKLLLEAMPELKKPEVYSKFWNEAVETMAEYGFSAEEMNATEDHRVYRLYRDLAAYRRARKNIPNVKQAVQSKPVLTGKKRMDPKVKTSRETQVASENLRKTGSFESGVRALENFDL